MATISQMASPTFTLATLLIWMLACMANVAAAGGNLSSNATGNSTINGDTGHEPTTGEGIFNVLDYGAVADGATENSKAFMQAWKEACAYGGGSSTLLVPKGTFMLGPITFRGPCFQNSLTKVIIKGTLKAFPDPNEYSIRWIEFHNLRNLIVKGKGTLDGQGSQAWVIDKCKRKKMCKHPPTTLRFIGVSDATLIDLNIMDSKGFHVKFHRCANIETRFLNISAPEDSPNTDGIHISGVENINVTHMNIATGDDCISLGQGAANVKIANITCGPGHGISVGSLGKYHNEKDVSNVRVRNCTLSGTTNGLRIKTWPAAPPSKAVNITFEDIILKEVKNPIIIDQEYCPIKRCKTEPSKVKLEGIAFRRVKGTSTSEVAVHMVCSETSPCKNVKLEDINVDYIDGKPSSTCSNVHAQFSGDQKPTPCM